MTTSTTINGFPNGFDITTLEQETIYRQIIDRNLFITESGLYDYSNQVSQMFITMVGGGGAGGLGTISGGVFTSGGGGGAGGGHNKCPVIIPEGISSVSVACSVGVGGTLENPDGKSTIISIICDGEPLKSFIATGGKGASGSSGGSHGVGNSVYDGKNGTDGNVVVSSQIQLGGDGGDSQFYNGGKGYYIGMDDPTLCIGNYGSGGGGMIPGIDSSQTFGNGGQGFIIVEYV